MALDPRPDLAADSALWRRLLAAAFELDADDPVGLYGALLGTRCCGGRLTWRSGRLRLEPGEMPDDWEADREKWLLPHGAALTTIMREVGEKVASEKAGGYLSTRGDA